MTINNWTGKFTSIIQVQTESSRINDKWTQRQVTGDYSVRGAKPKKEWQNEGAQETCEAPSSELECTVKLQKNRERTRRAYSKKKNNNWKCQDLGKEMNKQIWEAQRILNKKTQRNSHYRKLSKVKRQREVWNQQEKSDMGTLRSLRRWLNCHWKPCRMVGNGKNDVQNTERGLGKLNNLPTVTQHRSGIARTQTLPLFTRLVLHCSMRTFCFQKWKLHIACVQMNRKK
jgi:hypothetical protein